MTLVPGSVLDKKYLLLDRYPLLNMILIAKRVERMMMYLKSEQVYNECNHTAYVKHVYLII